MTKNFTKIDNDILELLCRIRLSNYEFRILLAIFRKTFGFIDKDGNQKQVDYIAPIQLSKMTGIDRRNISKILNNLLKKGLLIQINKKIGFNHSMLSSNQMTSSQGKVSSIRMSPNIPLDDKMSFNGMHTIDKIENIKERDWSVLETVRAELVAKGILTR